MGLEELTAVEIGQLIRNKKISCEEAVKASLKQIKKLDKKYNAYITLDEDNAIKNANEIQKKIECGKLNNILAGVPISVKDNICTKDILTTCASKMLKNFVPNYDAQVITNLKQQGAIILGKTNMDEFAMGNSTETSTFGVTKNPWNQERVSGGSSGGGAASVALNECFYSIGSDTGGSVRQPSAFCGVTGIKPTYGTISRYGLVAYASSMDQIGVIAKNVEDAAHILEIGSSYDRKDCTSMKRKEYDFTTCLVDDVKGLKIGIPENYLRDGLDVQIKQSILNVAKELEKKGAIVEEFELDLAEYTVPTYYIIACAEASSNLARFDGVKYGVRAKEYKNLDDMYKRTRTQGFGDEVKRRIMLGAFILSAEYYETYYLKAMKVRSLIKQSFEKVFRKYDIILTPTTPDVANKIGENSRKLIDTYLEDIYTVGANLAGLPAISIPCGINSDGLPIGVQFMGNLFREHDIIRAAYSYEVTQKHRKLVIV